MRIATALLCIFLLAVAAGFHLYWGLGGQTGIRIALPQQENGQPILPFSRAGSVAFGLVLVVVMLLIAAQAGMIDFPLPHALLRASVLLWACLFLARALSWHRYVGLFKQVHCTRFARYDTWLLSPGSLLLALGSFYLGTT